VSNTTAMPGDLVIAHVVTHPLFNDIVCDRLGDLNYTLSQMDLV